MNTTGMITDNGNRIIWGDKTVWARPDYSGLQNFNSNTNSNTPITRNDENIAVMPEIDLEERDDSENIIRASSDKSKQLPSSIATYLDTQFKVWEISPESELCGEKKLFEKGDFDGDGKTDYAVYFVVNKNSTNARQILYVFLNKGAYFQPFKISEDKDPKNFKFSSFAIVKKGEKLQTGEGENDVVILNVDAITKYT